MRIHARVGWLATAVFMVIAVFPAAAVGQTAGDDGGDAPAPTPGPIPAVLQLEAGDLAPGLANLVKGTVKLATQTGTGQFVGPLLSKPAGNGTVEFETHIDKDGVKSTVFRNRNDGLRSTATVEGEICPNEQGAVSAKITMSIESGSTHQRSLEADISGRADDNAALTDVNVKIKTGKGKDAALLDRLGRYMLKQFEAAWRGGACVTVDVSEGESRAVTPKEKVRISAIGKPRFGGGTIKGRMESKKTAGQRSIEPAQVSDTPAKFMYTAPDKPPERGEVELKSISKRGIGITTLEYTTAGDLKINAYGVTATKCGGPAGPWKLHFEPYGSGTGDANATFTLAEGTFTGPYAFSGFADIGGGFSETGSVMYVPSPNQSGTGTLVMNPRGPLPVTVGSYCTKGVPNG